jgi:phosphorylase kinase gamma subunit
VRHIQQLRLHPKPLNIAASKGDPYGQRLVRKVIDAGAFRIYGHWVKRGENQDRAALFEITPKKDLKDTKR